jgi:hypothetical protein
LARVGAKINQNTSFLRIIAQRKQKKKEKPSNSHPSPPVDSVSGPQRAQTQENHHRGTGTADCTEMGSATSKLSDEKSDKPSIKSHKTQVAISALKTMDERLQIREEKFGTYNQKSENEKASSHSPLFSTTLTIDVVQPQTGSRERFNEISSKASGNSAGPRTKPLHSLLLYLGVYIIISRTNLQKGHFPRGFRKYLTWRRAGVTGIRSHMDGTA